MKIMIALMLMLSSGCAFIQEATKYHPHEDASPESLRPGDNGYEQAKSDSFLDAAKKNCVIDEQGYVGNCGLVYDAMHDASGHLIRPEQCGEKTETDCAQLAATMYNAKIKLRYPLASWEQAQTVCESEGGCSTREYERKLLVIHDAKASKQFWSDYVAQMRASRPIICSSSYGLTVCR